MPAAIGATAIAWIARVLSGRLVADRGDGSDSGDYMRTSLKLSKAWFPYRCICRVCRTKKIHRTDITSWKPPIQMLNTKETTDSTCCTRKNEFYLSYEFFSIDRHDRYDRYNDIGANVLKLSKAWFPYRCICRICRVCRTKKNS